MFDSPLSTFALLFTIFVLAICGGAFVYSKLLRPRSGVAAPAQEQAAKATGPNKHNFFLLPGKKQLTSSHPLGPVQSVIRGRLRFIPFGLLFLAISCFALYSLHYLQVPMYFERNFLNNAFATVLFFGGVLWGLQLLYFSTCKVKLRQRGIELASVLGSQAYAYQEVDFYLQQTVEHKQHSHGYRPLFFKTGNYNLIWQCQIIFSDQRQPIVLKSSRYAWLRSKMQQLIDQLYAKDQPGP